MKAKTVWIDIPDWWLFQGEICLDYDCDARWLNCYGYEIRDAALDKGSKIIGDLDE